MHRRRSGFRAPIHSLSDPGEETHHAFHVVDDPRGYAAVAPDTLPDAVAVARMMVYNRELQHAGVLLGLDGLHPPSMGARVSFEGGRPTVTEGRFAEAREVLGGYWMLDVASRGEAIEWARRCPAGPNEIIEVRQVQETADFPEDVQAAGFEGMQVKTAAGSESSRR